MISLTKSAARYVSKLSNKLRRKLDMLSSRKEFSGSQGRTLHFLLAQTEDVFQKDIEEEYSIRPSTATELLKQMEANGLIRREPVAYDNRLKKIVLTDKALMYKQQVATVYKGNTIKKLNHGLPILHKVPPKRDYGRYFCIMAEKGGTPRGDLAEKLSSFFHA